MDRAISASDANRNFSSILRDVRSGASFVVESRGTPVARIVPLQDKSEDRAASREAIRRRWREEGDAPIIVAPWTRDELYDRDDEDRPWLKR